MLLRTRFRLKDGAGKVVGRYSGHVICKLGVHGETHPRMMSPRYAYMRKQKHQYAVRMFEILEEHLSSTHHIYTIRPF